MGLEKKITLAKINRDLRKIIIELCYLDICNFIETIKLQFSSTSGKVSFSNGLMIKYSYTPAHYESIKGKDIATLECHLLYDSKVPVLYFRSLIYEGKKSLWNLRKEFAYRETSFSLGQASLILQLLDSKKVKETENYQTIFHAAPWMVEYLREVLKKKKATLQNQIPTTFEYSQEEIDNPENRELKIEDKQAVREELESVLNDFKNELKRSLMQAREEVALTEENMELVDLYIAKIGEALALSTSKKVEKGNVKKLR